MLETKNVSPVKLAAWVALAIAAPAALGVWALTGSGWAALIFFALLGLLSFGLVRYVFERHIQHKIKLIYKLIHQTKATRKEEMYYKYLLPPRNLEEVRDDVEAWMIRKNQEIEMLQRNESYRREFLQNLAHEFKTPIFAIQGYVETLLEGEAEEPATQKRFLEHTARNVERLVSLVKDLDEITRLESGAPLQCSSFVIQDAIREAFETLALKMRRRQMTASIKKGCEAPITVYADRDKIRQVLLNLVENAVKYGKQEGQITASIYITDDEHALVEISDDGIGIEADHLPRVFERFYRTDEARSRDQGGTGLGLAICKHIIEAHGQPIHVRSTPDVGTTIGFTLDLRPREAA